MDVNKTADLILAELTGRSGFDGVWDGCDQDIQAEIRQAIRAILVTAVPNPEPGTAAHIAQHGPPKGWVAKDSPWKCACGHELVGDPSMPPFYCVGGDACTCAQCKNDHHDTCGECGRPVAGVADEADHNTGACGCAKSKALCWRHWNQDVCCVESPYWVGPKG